MNFQNSEKESRKPQVLENRTNQQATNPATRPLPVFMDMSITDQASIARGQAILLFYIVLAANV